MSEYPAGYPYSADQLGDDEGGCAICHEVVPKIELTETDVDVTGNKQPVCAECLS